ncbi:WD40 repeat domain-containing protein [Nonomuraea cavernae]|uniref:WD40 repeat domain-containing protein n=1 Tax=Nonomuraea cavernae TaxID=2045107 RepID=UPI00166C134B|nr:WD40 repeat domain-containing protein [Nonomuraea cavernae]MCA2187150.1 WD40 repeat domain-containing protein [Nonomuraea cavernae]
MLAFGGALTVAATLVVAQAPQASAADSTTYLNGATVGGDVAAGAGKVFVAANDRIIVANAGGELTGAITGLSGVVGLAMTPDGTRLYSALSGSMQVAEIDTADLSIIRRIDLAGFPCPSNLALSGDRLWVGYGCRFTWGGGILGLDLTATAPQPIAVGNNTSSAPLVAAAGDTLLAGDPDIMPADLMVYDVSATPATLRGVIAGLPSLGDLAATPDGSMAITVVGGGKQYDVWDTTSLTKARSYGADPAMGATRAVAVSPDGVHLAGGRSGDPRLTLYDTATGTRTYTNDDPVGELVPGSLTFSGTDVYGVLKERNSNGRLHLWRLHGATLPASTLTLTPPPTPATVLQPLSMTGRLTLSDESAPGAQSLMVIRRVPYRADETLPGVTTAADGTFTVTDTPPFAGDISYDVVWDGGPDARWSRASVTVPVEFIQSSLTLSGPGEGIAGQELQFSGTFEIGDQPAPPGSWLWVDRIVHIPGGTAAITLPGVTTASDGSFSFTDTPADAGQYTYIVRADESVVSSATEARHNVTVTNGDSPLL